MPPNPRRPRRSYAPPRQRLARGSFRQAPCRVPPAVKTETIRSNLIDPLLQRGECRIGAPQIALDGAQAHAEFRGELALRNSVDAVAAKYRGRALTHGAESFQRQPGLFTADQVPLGRRGIGYAADSPVVRLAPVPLASLRLSHRPVAIDHQRIGGTVEVRKRRSDRTAVARRDLQPDFLQQILGSLSRPARKEKAQQAIAIRKKDLLEARAGAIRRQVRQTHVSRRRYRAEGDAATGASIPSIDPGAYCRCAAERLRPRSAGFSRCRQPQ